jgi:hypothetical protein
LPSADVPPRTFGSSRVLAPEQRRKRCDRAVSIRGSRWLTGVARPAIPSRAGAAASIASRPTYRDDRETPLWRAGMECGLAETIISVNQNILRHRLLTCIWRVLPVGRREELGQKARRTRRIVTTELDRAGAPTWVTPEPVRAGQWRLLRHHNQIATCGTRRSPRLRDRVVRGPHIWNHNAGHFSVPPPE